MNEIVSINELETKINVLKQQTAQNIIEIGNCLNQAKEQVAHGEWKTWLSEKVDFSYVQATRFMRIAEEFPNVSALKDLGQSKVFALLELPEEERQPFLEENQDREMTTREWQKAINEKKQLEKRVKELESREPKVIEKVIEKTVPHPKYYETKKQLQDLELESQRLEMERDNYKRKSELNERQSEEYKKIKDDLSIIKQSKDSIKRQLDATNELSTLVRQIDHFIKEQLAPVKYSRALRELRHDDHVQKNLNEIIGAVEEWLEEIKTYIDKGEVIDV